MPRADAENNDIGNQGFALFGRAEGKIEKLRNQNRLRDVRGGILSNTKKDARKKFTLIKFVLFQKRRTLRLT